VHICRQRRRQSDRGWVLVNGWARGSHGTPGSAASLLFPGLNDDPSAPECFGQPRAAVLQPRGTSPATTGPGVRPRAVTPGPDGAAEARGRSCPRHCWGLWTVGRWPALPSDSGGEAGRGNRRSSACPRPVPPTRGPHAAVPPAPNGVRRALWRTVPGELSGGNWMARGGPAVRRAGRSGRAQPAPSNVLFLPFRGCHVRGRPHRRAA
jgi:hypothetical protein